jgi:hypothetical protein
MMTVSQLHSTATSIGDEGALLIVLLIFWALLIMYAMYGVVLWRRGRKIPFTTSVSVNLTIHLA